MRDLFNNKLFIYIFLPVLAVLLGTCIYTLMRDPKDVSQAKKFPYVSRRVFVEDPNDILINFVPLRTELRAYIQNVSPNNLGMYFEYLPSGVSIGINNDFTNNIASLLKVPLVMAVYKQIETGALKEDQLLTITSEHLDDRSGTVYKRGAGSKITVKEAAEKSIQESDNTTSNLLLDNIPPRALADVFDYLDMPREKQGSFVVISPKYYSSVMRSLYLSAYLKQQYSNEILDMLTKSTFNKRIPAGVDSSVKVAHKYGEYEDPSAELRINSDCGIVYVPKRPYILCIMTNAHKEDANKYMSEMSKKIYDYVKNASSSSLNTSSEK